MEARRRKLEVLTPIARLASACIVCCTLAVAALAQEQGGLNTATGRLTLNGKSVPLAHAYASAQPGFFDKNKDDIHVLLSSVALSDKDREDVFALSKLARDGRASILEVVIDADGKPIGGSLFTKAFDSGMVSVAGMHEFTKERMEPKIIAGRLTSGGPHEFMKVTWEYDARFSAAIPRPPTAEETAAALATPAAKAASAYLAAMRQGQLPAFLATLDATAAADYKGADGAAKLKQLQADFPRDAKVVGLTTQPDGTALAEVEGHQDGVIIAYTLKMVMVGGAWKVGK